MRLDLSDYFEEASEYYKSPSQVVRFVSEKWFLENGYCPACARDSITQYSANRPVLDFFCRHCKQDYQLKGKKNSFGNKVLDGRYEKMIGAVNENRAPNFAFLLYDLRQFKVTNLFFVPKFFFSASIIEKRKPLSENAQREGWIGCNILFTNIPEIGKIHAVKNGEIFRAEAVRSSWRKVEFMSEFKNSEARGWTSDVIRCVDLIENKEFELSDCYKFESKLSELHPENQNIRPKIRQQLQIMRDKGLIEFLGNGVYRKK